MNDIEVLIAYFVLTFIVILFIIGVNNKLYSSIKNEEHREKGKVIQSIIKAYSLVQCISWPFLCGFELFIVFNNFIFELIGPSKACYFAFVHRFLFVLTIHYIGFHSLIIAICRYVFLVFETKAEAVGIKKLRKIFIGSSVIIPFLSTLLYDSCNPIEEAYLILLYNKTHSQIENESSIYPNKGINTIEYESPIFLAAQKYFPSGINQILNVTGLIVAFTLYSNTLEGVLYPLMFIYYNR